MKVLSLLARGGSARGAAALLSRSDPSLSSVSLPVSRPSLSACVGPIQSALSRRVSCSSLPTGNSASASASGSGSGSGSGSVCLPVPSSLSLTAAGTSALAVPLLAAGTAGLGGVDTHVASSLSVSSSPSASLRLTIGTMTEWFFAPSILSPSPSLGSLSPSLGSLSLSPSPSVCLLVSTNPW